MNKELAAVIVETRPLPNLIEIITNHLKFLPEYTRLYVFGSEEVYDILDEAEIQADFYLVGDEIGTVQYNNLLTNINFWDFIDEENILIFQHDSMILRDGIEDFYQWDYVGSPWKFQFHGGNGGLSFRHKSAMIKILQTAPRYNIAIHGNEDIYFSNYLMQGYKLAPRHICDMFSCETIYRLGTFGYHAIEKYLTKEQCQIIKTQYK